MHDQDDARHHVGWELDRGVPSSRIRLLHMEVYQNDQLVLRTLFDAPDHEGPSDFWRRTGVEPFASEDKVAPVKADEHNPLLATLTGSVRIKIMHVDRLMTSASLTNLFCCAAGPRI